MEANFKQYLKGIEDALKAGNATEHTHRPALKTLLEELDERIIATNEPKRIACGAPDYIITRNDLSIGYIEAKDVGKSLHEIERGEQLKRYKRALGNLILTDYLEFRWYVDGELRQEARLARPETSGKLKNEKGGVQAVEELLGNFLAHQTESVNSPKDLAERMAKLTHIIRDIIVTAFETEQASNLLKSWRQAFAQVLIADLELPERTADFADMVAQTLAYGLFSARMMDTTPESFSRHEAQKLIPKSNPFLRRFFSKITSVDLDDEPFAPFVDDLVNLLANTDMPAVLADFGKRTRQEDPIVHFYETFLAAYDPKLRESRGVYYTPEPVVSYIVRSVDHLLKTRFDAPQGLADSSKISIPNYDPSIKVKGKTEIRKTAESHKVIILDPATGTGTFLYAVIDHIRQQFIDSGNAGMWTGYVKNHLLPRLFGFELLMAPYAVAHFKLSMQLAGRDLPPEMAEKWAYIPEEGERLGVYLTDALEEAHEMTGLPLFTQWVSDETIAANKVKRHLPVLVVMGNPPYSYESENNGEWISSLIRDYYEVDGKPLGERNPKGLQDDYVKFIRFAQWRVEQSGSGIVAFISNNGYLDNPTFRGMRQSLMKTFDEIYILDLHGNSKKKEVSPDGSKDENVFDIQQGVSIGVFVKKTQEIDNAKIYHADLWGRRANKYETLLEDEIKTTNWNRLDPKSQFYLFTPQDKNLLEEYNHCNSINSVFDLNSVGIATSRDKLTIHFSANNALNVVEKFVSMSPEQARAEFNLGKDTRDWKVHLAQEDLKKNETSIDFVKRILYRPFDFRYTYYTGVTRGFISMPRYKLIRHMLHSNMGLFVGRQGQAIGGDEWNLIFCGNVMEDYNLYRRGNNACFPLYIYPDADERGQKSLFDTPVWQADEANDGRVPNLDPAFVAEISEKLGLVFQPNQTGFDEKFFTPEDIFHYIYAIFHSPTYRIRYAEFLKIDFPRVPLTSDVDLFRTLCELGKELVGLHLLESPEVSQHITRYPVAGDNLVEKGYPKYHPHPNLPPQGEGIKDSPPSGGDVRRTEGGGRVQINKIQYFEGISPEVWEFHVGGYQVLDKWLKDRRGRQLSYDDLTHYQNIVVSLEKTIQLMKEIDQTIPEFPIK